MNILLVIYNEKKIYFVPNDEGFKELPGDYSLVSMSKTKSEIFEDFLAFSGRNDSDQLVYMNKQVKKTFTLFCSNFKKIEAAGGLIENRKEEFLFIYRRNKWDLPKGKIDKGETPRKAAVRECMEECGISGLKITGTLTPTYHMYDMKAKIILKKTHWFKMQSENTMQLNPQTEEGITEVKWIKKSGLGKVKKNTYFTILQVLQSSQ